MYVITLYCGRDPQSSKGLLWLFHNRSFVLSSERENEIVDTIGTLLHHIHVEFYIRMPCLLSTVFVTYFLEIREEAKKRKMLRKAITRHKLMNDG